MIWNTRYNPPDTKSWQGRPDVPLGSCFFQIIQPLHLNQPLPPAVQEKQAFALIGFCCDEGIRRNLGRPGAAKGPGVIREILAKLPVQKQNFVCYDAGDINCTDGDLENSQAALGEVVNLLLQAGMTPIVLGGGHELAWGHYQGIAKKFPDERLGIVNFDAHFDMRPLLPNGDGSSGTPFLQIALAHQSAKRSFDYNCIGIQHAGNIRQLFDTAKKYHAQILLADDLHQGYMDKCINFIDRVIDQNQIIYLSLCLDVFAAPYAPGVSAPQTLGITPWQIMPLVRQLAASGKVISYDIAELCPPHDIDYRTAKLAANFIYEIIHHHVHTIGIHHGHNQSAS
jgi:formiminoglutamase